MIDQMAQHVPADLRTSTFSHVIKEKEKEGEMPSILQKSIVAEMIIPEEPNPQDFDQLFQGD